MNREQQKQQTRKTILQSAAELFKENGYEKVSTRNIAKHSNVGVGTVFSHFSDKGSLTRALFHEQLETVLKDLLPLAQGQTGMDYFYTYALGLYQFYDQDRAFSIALLQNSLFDSDYFAVQMDQFVQTIAQRIKAQVNVRSEQQLQVLARAIFNFYLQNLFLGLSQQRTGPDDWLKQLKIDCGLLLPFYTR